VECLWAGETHLVAQSIDELELDFFPVELSFVIEEMGLYDRQLKFVLKCGPKANVCNGLFVYAIDLTAG